VSPERRKRLFRGLAVLAISVGLVVALNVHSDSHSPSIKPVTLPQMLAALPGAKQVTLDASSDSVRLVEHSGQVVDTLIPPGWEAQLTQRVLAAKVPFKVTTSAPGLLVSLVPLVQLLAPLLLAGLVLFSLRGNFSRFRQVAVGKVPDERFGDVAGLPEVVDELAELVTALRTPEAYTKVGALPPRGVLLVGPPGTGKTLLARAVAGESGVAFFSLSGSDFVEMFAGLGASRVRRVFAKAKEAGKAVVFIDELDAVGRKRASQTLDGGHSEREATLNQLLVELDGFAKRPGVIVLGATNRSDVLDPALVRAGRFDRHITVPLPDRKAREQILAVHLSKTKMASDLDLSRWGPPTVGMSGADLANVANQAALAAVRRNSDVVEACDIDSALETVRLGRARPSVWRTERDVAVAAWHEAGHAVVAWLAEHVPNPTVVSIVPRSGTGGATWLPADDNQYFTATEAWERLKVLLGGNAGERLLLGDCTQGAADDLAKAKELATGLVEVWGYAGWEAVCAPEDVRAAKVGELIAKAQAEALVVLEAHRLMVQRVAEALCERQRLDGNELAQVIASVGNGKPTLALR